MKPFSDLLVKRTQKYFKQRYNLDISDETAEEYLHAMAGLYATFIEFLEFQADTGVP